MRLLIAIVLLAGCAEDRGLSLDTPTGLPSEDAARSADDEGPYHGGDRVDVGAADVVLGAPARAHFGMRLAMPGDIDGDGFDDLLVSAAGLEASVSCGSEPPCVGLNRSGVYVVYGDADRDAPIAARSALLLGWNTLSGELLPAAAGDVDGDGRADFFIGVSPALCEPGGAVLVYGARFSDTLELRDAGVLYRDDAPCSSFGLPHGLGDIDGDGFGDYAIAAPGRHGASGVLYGFYGRADRLSVPQLATDAPFLLRERARGDSFGHAVGAGDVDGDGVDDFVIGRDALDATQRLVRGGPRFSGALDVDDLSVALESPAGGLARPVPAGDLDGDGRQDLLLVESFLTARRIASIFYGRENWPASLGPDDADAWLIAEPDEPRCVRAAAAGDIDGDGHRDLLCADELHGDGAASLWLGSGERRSGEIRLADESARFIGRSLEAQEGGIGGADRTGSAVAAGGDFDGDGLHDFAISAPSSVSGDDHAGHVYVFFGRRE